MNEFVEIEWGSKERRRHHIFNCISSNVMIHHFGSAFPDQNDGLHSRLRGGGGAATTPTQGHRGALIKANDVTVLMTMLTSFYVGGVSIIVKRSMRRLYINSIMILHLLSNLFYSSILANINNQTIIILLSAPNLNLHNK